MLNKRKPKGKMVSKFKKTKEREEQTKALFVSKKKGSVFKHSAKKKVLPSKADGPSTSSDYLPETMPLYQRQSIAKQKSKKMKGHVQHYNHDMKEAIASGETKKNQAPSPKNTPKCKHKMTKKKIDTDQFKTMKASKRAKENNAVSQEMSASKDKRKKRRELPSGDDGSTGTGPAAPPAGVLSSQPARLTLAGGFSWETSPWPQSAPPPAGADSSDDDDNTEQQPAARLSRQQLRERAAAEERQLVERERRLMDPSRALETADDHERLVVAHPDDSSLWIRFMSYFLQATEIEKARGVARRALKTINFREEDEKLNVYVAWLNLESMHGTQETLSNVLHEALQYNDTFKVYTRMAEIHQANNKHDEAELMYSQLVKKLPARKEAWLRYGVFLMQVGRREAARALMQRALKCLDRRDHVEVISKFAQLEFRFGEPERGKTMFDHLLSTYPKRLDQWNVYVNQLIKSADYDAARLIFQRAATVRLNARRVRSLLKRFLEFEEAHGTAEQQEAVRQLARQYLESRSETDAALLDQPVR